MDNLVKLNKAKTSLKGSITRMETFFDNLSEDVDKTLLDVKLKKIDQLQQKLEELKEISFGIETATQTEEAEFEDDLDNCEIRLEDLELSFELESLGIKDEPCYREDYEAMNVFKETVRYNNNHKAQRRGSDYRRKRKRFHNNQYTRKVSDKLDVDCISASAKKLFKESDLDKEVRNSNQSNGYRLINIDILLSELSQYVTCPNCNTKAVLKEKILYGLVSEFYVECYSCSTLSTFKSSPVITSGKDYEVNTRITYAMRTVGQGFCGIKHFCTTMDLPPPVSQKAYEKILRKINLASCVVADNSMKNAAKEEILASGSNEICVSGDGSDSWKLPTTISKTDIQRIGSKEFRSFGIFASTPKLGRRFKTILMKAVADDNTLAERVRGVFN
ncbi:uncharacterized protein TNCT_195511 [Trichonephila clavata]|uniref:Mutator-like transposase domain-containing protein n=1 Tax=Trichonephila clavata TaxID=2740835 RepID=A0A8X6LUE1_TRICU|nr:uncharacterized protein TNCT_195511 [Trichonephila clavata]